MYVLLLLFLPLGFGRKSCARLILTILKLLTYDSLLEPLDLCLELLHQLGPTQLPPVFALPMAAWTLRHKILGIH